MLIKPDISSAVQRRLKVDIVAFTRDPTTAAVIKLPATQKRYYANLLKTKLKIAAPEILATEKGMYSVKTGAVYSGWPAVRVYFACSKKVRVVKGLTGKIHCGGTAIVYKEGVLTQKISVAIESMIR